MSPFLSRPSLPQSSESWGYVMRTHSSRHPLGVYYCLVHTQLRFASEEDPGFAPKEALQQGPTALDDCSGAPLWPFCKLGLLLCSQQLRPA